MKNPLNQAWFKNQKGLSLFEVLIYAVLSLIVLTLAVTSLGRLQKNAYNNQEMARMQGDADEAVRMVSQDIRNLGLKRVVFSPSSGVLVDSQLTKVDYTPADTSSFIHKEGNPYDTLTFIKPQLNAIGKPISIDTIQYKVDPATRTLIRTVNRISPVAICQQVDAMQFEYGIFATKTTLLTENPMNLTHWSQNPTGLVTVSGSTLKAVLTGSGNVSFWVSNRPLTLVTNHTYRIEMRNMANAGFISNVRNMYAILCNGSGTLLASQTFLPTTTLTTQYLDWSGIACTNCYAGFRMEMNGAGEFDLTFLQLNDVEQADGTWVSAPTTVQKKAARSIRLSLLTRSSKKVLGTHGGSINLANIQLTYNDKLSRSLLQDVLAIPNNGN